MSNLTPTSIHRDEIKIIKTYRWPGILLCMFLFSVSVNTTWETRKTYVMEQVRSTTKRAYIEGYSDGLRNFQAMEHQLNIQESQLHHLQRIVLDNHGECKMISPFPEDAWPNLSQIKNPDSNCMSYDTLAGK